MNDELDRLYCILSQQYELYTDFLEVEKRKLDTIVNDNTVELDKIVEEEQVFFLKSRGLESKRVQTLKNLNMQDKTLLEITKLVDNDQKPKFEDIYKKISQILADLKLKNSQCQDLTQIRLHRINTIINKLDNNDENRQLYECDGKNGKKDISKINFVSKKI